MRRAWLPLALAVVGASLGWSPGAVLYEGPWAMRSRDFGASASLPGASITKRNGGALKLLWRFPADDAIPDAPAVGPESVVVGSPRGTLYALDPDTGRVRWRVSVGAVPLVAYGFTSLGIGGTPAIVRGRVYTATAATDLACLNEATGASCGAPGSGIPHWARRSGQLRSSGRAVSTSGSTASSTSPSRAGSLPWTRPRGRWSGCTSSPSTPAGAERECWGARALIRHLEDGRELADVAGISPATASRPVGGRGSTPPQGEPGA